MLKKLLKPQTFSLFISSVPFLKRCTYFAQILAFIKRVSWIPAVLKFTTICCSERQEPKFMVRFQKGHILPHVDSSSQSANENERVLKERMEQKKGKKKRDHLSAKTLVVAHPAHIINIGKISVNKHVTVFVSKERGRANAHVIQSFWNWVSVWIAISTWSELSSISDPRDVFP